jgi:hypothetical protein
MKRDRGQSQTLEGAQTGLSLMGLTPVEHRTENLLQSPDCLRNVRLLANAT